MAVYYNRSIIYLKEKLNVDVTVDGGMRRLMIYHKDFGWKHIMASNEV